MANKLDVVMHLATCRVCLGNGGLGNRTVIVFAGYGQDTQSKYEFKKCEACGGTGVDPDFEYAENPG